MDGRWLVRGVILAAAIGVAVYMKMGARADDSKAIRADIMQVVATMPEYATHTKLLDAYAGLAHTRAFGEAYTVGGRRQRNQFNEDAYIERFFKSMIDSANGDGRQDLARPLMALRDRFNDARKTADPSGKP